MTDVLPPDYWNIGRPKVIVASLHELEPATAVLLESQLDRVRFESNRQSEALVLSVFDGKIPVVLSTDESVLTGKALVETAVATLEQLPSPISASHFKMRNVDDRVFVEVTVEVKEELRLELCAKPMWRLDVRCRIADGGFELDR